MDELLDILRDLHPDVDFETCTNMNDAGILESFEIVTIIAEIDEVFDVQLPADQIIPENFNSAAALWALIQKLIEEDD